MPYPYDTNAWASFGRYARGLNRASTRNASTSSRRLGRPDPNSMTRARSTASSSILTASVIFPLFSG